MTLFGSRRSRIHLMLVALVGLALVFAAYDIIAGHWLSSPPTTDDAGALTTKGQTQRRLDLVWGSVFLVTGIGLFAAAIKNLVERAPLAEVTDSGLRLRVLGPNRYLVVPWTDIVDIRSHRDPGSGRHPRPVLLVAVGHPEWYPVDLWGAEWTGTWLRVDADQWVEPVEEFVVRARLELDRERREPAPNPDSP